MTDILILNFDYGVFSDWLYDAHDGLEDRSYEEQLRTRLETLTGGAVFYHEQFEEAGHDVRSVFVNNRRMQHRWAAERGSGEVTESSDVTRRLLRAGWSAVSDTPLSGLKSYVKPILGEDSLQESWFYDILRDQLSFYQPDIVINRAVGNVSSAFLREQDGNYGLLVGEIGTEIPDEDLSVYDCVFALLDEVVAQLESRGVDAFRLNRGFGTSILDAIEDRDPTIPVSFVGSISPRHTNRRKTLETVAEKSSLQWWGPGTDDLPANSPLHSCYQGQAWGREMYQRLADSKVTLNAHIDLAGDHAVNHRLFEATGVGTCLLTDWKPTLEEVFEPGTEVETYRTPSECAELANTLLDADQRRRKIATAGQERTLAEHTYNHRIDRIDEILARYTD